LRRSKYIDYDITVSIAYTNWYYC